MEYDNDRKVKHAYKIEIFYWLVLGLISPLVNTVTIFSADLKMLPVLLLINLFILPAYVLYAQVIAPTYLFTKNYLLLIIVSIAFLFLLQTFLYGLYSIVLQFHLLPVEQTYFSYSYNTITREVLWFIINLSIATGVCYVKKALDEKELLIAVEKDNTNFKLRYLRSQLNPHFLFNTLNSIYSLSLQKSDKAPEVVVKLADLMRYLIYECNSDKVPLNKEIAFIENYIEIEKIRHKADVRFSIEGETEGIMIEPYLFISFIENGFKHAFDNAYSDAFVYITIKVQPQEIILSVVNNTNIDMATQAKRIEGTGIRNSKNLLELLYPDSYALNIIQTDREEQRKSELRIKNAKKRLQTLYPDSHTLDVILSNNAFTVSLIIKPSLLDKMHYS